MKVLVVDGDQVTAEVVAYALQREGFQVVQAHDGLSALERWAVEHPDLLILDIDLPRLDGLSVCQRIRKEADTPIIFLSVRCADADVVQGLEMGADAYLGKPFSPRQLVARVYALLRRTSQLQPASAKWFGGLHQLNYRTISLTQGGRVHLTPLEGRLLEFLSEKPGQVQSYEAIMEHLWGVRKGDRAMLRQLVHRLRGKIEADSARPTCIITVPGRGYILTGVPGQRET